MSEVSLKVTKPELFHLSGQFQLYYILFNLERTYYFCSFGHQPIEYDLVVTKVTAEIQKY